MKRLVLVLVALSWLPGGHEAVAQVMQWRLGKGGDQGWAERTGLNVMVDDASVPGAIQPLELKPDQNVVTQLRNWTRYRKPIDLSYRPGMPRIWRGIGDVPNALHKEEELEFVDGDLDTYYAGKKTGEGGTAGAWGMFYSLDLGAQMPVERFVVVPPEGVDPLSQEPFRPNYAFKQYQLTASNDLVLVENQVQTAGGVPGVECGCPDYYQPLDIPLASVGQNFDPVIDIRFPLQYLRFFRIRFIPDEQGESIRFTRFALAELEVYGRGFVPLARWESQVVDLGQLVNLGQVLFGVSKWRRAGGQLVPAPSAPAGVKVEVRTGLDDTPTAYYSYNDMGQPVEVSEAQYGKLKPRVLPWDPPAVGWRGPIVDDEQNWSFWSAPMRTSGQRPRVGRGRYLQVRVEMETQSLWEFARMESLAVETSPLLADRVLGEVAVATDLQPEEGLVRVRAGAPTEFVYELGAEFSGTGQPGFDAVRLLLPSAGRFLALEMGEPPVRVAPDSVEEEEGFAVYLPQRIGPAGVRRARLRLETAVYGAAGELRAEVFERSGMTLPQGVEAGDVSAEVGTGQLRVVALAESLEAVLGEVSVQPAVFTPQGDGVNEQVQIGYTLFRVLAAPQVVAAVYTLAGERVWQQRLEGQSAGRHRVEWDGRDAQGRRVGPGVYLARVGVETDGGEVVRVRSLAVAY